MAIELWFGQFHIIDGIAHEEGPNIGVFEGAGATRGAPPIHVFVVVEPCGGAPAALCSTAVELVARGFGGPGQPITANLLRALTAVNEYVAGRRPQGAPATFGVGLTIMALRGQEAYLVQSGPSLAVLRAGSATRVIQPLTEDAGRPVGSLPRATPSIARAQLAPGDTVILLFSSAGRLVEHARLIQVAGMAPERALPDLYVRARGEQTFAALYVAALNPAEVAAVLRGETPAAEPVNLTAAVEEAAGPKPAPLPLPDEGRVAGQAPEGAAGGIQGWLGRVRGLRSGGSSDRTRQSALSSLVDRPPRFSRRQVALSLGLAAGGVLMLATIPALIRRGTSEEFDSLVASVERAVSQAESEADPARRRGLLERALTDLEAARTLRPEADLSILSERVTRQVADLDGVRELVDLVQLVDLAAPGLAAQAASQIAAGPLLYLLDAAGGRVIGLAREGDPRPVTVFQEGRPAGAVTTGKARHIAWWPAEGTRPGQLLVLDQSRRLFAVDEGGGIRTVALGDAAAWRSDTAMIAGSSHLYVLDGVAGQVWRYAQNANGFPSAPEALLNERGSLRDANGIGLVGGPVVSSLDGHLSRIVDGEARVFEVTALDRPLLAAGPPILNQGDGLYYIADRGNQRIVRMDAQGVFRGQLVHHRLAGLQALALDESGNALYALTGQSLVRASVPA